MFFSLQEVDAGLLTVIGYPAFAVRDPSLIQETRDFIRQKLDVSVCMWWWLAFSHCLDKALLWSGTHGTGLWSDSPFLSPQFFCLGLLLILSFHVSASGPFSFFSRKCLVFFMKSWAFFYIKWRILKCIFHFAYDRVWVSSCSNSVQLMGW